MTIKKKLEALQSKVYEDLQKSLKSDYATMVKDHPQGAEVAKWAAEKLPNRNWGTWYLKSFKKDPSIHTPENQKALEHFTGMQHLKEVKDHRFDPAHDFKTGMESLKAAEAHGLQRTSEKDRLVTAEGTRITEPRNGMAWYDLGRGSCTKEGAAMGHCGNEPSEVEGDRILSLRKEVTVNGQKLHQPHATFIENDGWLGEMKGRFNQKPGPELHDHIVDLLASDRIKHVAGGGYEPQRNFSLHDLSGDKKTLLLKKKPQLNVFNLKPRDEKALSVHWKHKEDVGDLLKYRAKARVRAKKYRVGEAEQILHEVKNPSTMVGYKAPEMALNLIPDVHRHLKEILSSRAETAHKNHALLLTEDPELIQIGLNDPNREVRAMAAGHPKATSEQISLAQNDKSASVRLAAIENENATEKHIMKAIAEDDDDDLFHPAAARHKNNTPKSLEAILRLPRSTWAKLDALKNPNINGDHISLAIKDSNGLVQRAAVRHSKANAEHIAFGLSSEDQEVQHAALNNENLSEEHLHQILDSGRSDLADRAMRYHKKVNSSHIEKGLKSEQIRLRQTSAGHVKANEDQIGRAIGDGDPRVARAAINNPSATENNLLAALKSGDDNLIDAVLHRDTLPERVIDHALGLSQRYNRVNAARHADATEANIDRALQDPDEEVRLFAIRNYNATERNVERALDDDHSNVVWGAVHHRNVTPRLLKKMLGHKDWPVAQAAAGADDATPEILDLAMAHSKYQVRQSAVGNGNSLERHLQMGLRDEDPYVRSSAEFAARKRGWDHLIAQAEAEKKAAEKAKKKSGSWTVDASPLGIGKPEDTKKSWVIEPIDLIKSDEDLEKGLKEAALGAAIAAGISVSAQNVSATQDKSHVGHSAERPVFAVHPELKHIAFIESSGGKNKNHKTVESGLNTGHTAGGSTGLMPLTIKDIVRQNPSLHQKYGHLRAMSADEITDFTNKNEHAESEIANAHWNRLINIFPDSPSRRAYAWRRGITASLKASDEKVESHPYVKKFNELRNASVVASMGKSEGLEKAPLIFDADHAEEKSPYREVWRMQDEHGMGPYGPLGLPMKTHQPHPSEDSGFSRDDRVDLSHRGNHGDRTVRFGFENEEQMNSWFTPEERQALSAKGYKPTKVKAAKVWSSGKQVFYLPHVELEKRDYYGRGLPHGWISPQGEFHEMGSDEDHREVIAHHIGMPMEHEEDERPVEEAYKKGWVSFGHAGEMNIQGHHEVLNNRSHPAMKMARNIVSAALDNAPEESELTVHHFHPETGSKMSSADSAHFARHGTFRPTMMKSQSLGHSLQGPTARVGAQALDTVSIPKDEFIDEHERLIDVLESPSHEDDKKEAKKQKKELQEALAKIDPIDISKSHILMFPVSINGKTKDEHEDLPDYHLTLKWMGDEPHKSMSEIEAIVRSHDVKPPEHIVITPHKFNTPRGVAHTLLVHGLDGSAHAAKLALDEGRADAHAFIPHISVSKHIHDMVKEGGLTAGDLNLKVHPLEYRIGTNTVRRFDLVAAPLSKVDIMEQGALQGWISPKGEFHPVEGDEDHFQFIARTRNLDPMEVGEAHLRTAYNDGYLSLGHAGGHNIVGSKKVLSDARNPAMRKARELLRQSSSPEVEITEIESNKPLKACTSTLCRYGKIKPLRKSERLKEKLLAEDTKEGRKLKARVGLLRALKELKVKNPGIDWAKLFPKNSLKAKDLRKALDEIGEQLEKMSRPSIKFPGLPKLSTRPDQEVQLIETGRQKELFGRKVAQAHSPSASQEWKNKSAKHVAGRFSRNTLGVEYDSKTGSKAAALAGKMRSRFEDGDEKDQAKLAEHREKRVAAIKEHNAKVDAWQSEYNSLRSAHLKAKTPEERTQTYSAVLEHQRKVPKWKAPRKPVVKRKATKDLPLDQMKSRGRGVESTIHHEALHYTLGEMRRHYGSNFGNQVRRELVGKFEPSAMDHVKSYITEKKGYKRNNPYFEEELLTHARDILVNPKTRKSFAAHVYEKTGVLKRLNESNEGEIAIKVIKQLKSGLQAAYEHAKTIKPPKESS